MKYLGNAFSLQMLDTDKSYNVNIQSISASDYIINEVKNGNITSVIGHPDLANILGVPCNRVSVHLNPDDILYVAQVVGGRLPVGTTELPEDTKIVFLRVAIL